MCIFCPHCGSLASVSSDVSSVSSMMPEYDDWNPPAASTVYCELYNVPYGSFKYNRGSGVFPVAYNEVQRKLEERRYNCGVCSCNLDGFCTKKRCPVSPDAICKSFEVQRKSTSRQHRMPRWYFPK